MKRGNLKLKFLACFIMLLLICSGCSAPHNNIVNTDELAQMMHKEEEAKGNFEVVRLNNGVVVYKDHANTKAPNDYRDPVVRTSLPDIKFGPRDLTFDPNNVNPK